MKKNVCISIVLMLSLMFQWNMLFVPAEEGDLISESSIQNGSQNSDKEVNKSKNNVELSDIQPIVERGTLRVAMLSEDLKPFWQTTEDGSTVGFEYDLAKGIADSLGVKLELNRTLDTNNALVDLVASGDADIAISVISDTVDRAMKVDFSNSYLSVPFGLMINKKELVSNNIENNPLNYLKTNSVKIAAIKGSSHVKMVNDLFPKTEVVEKESYDECCKAVIDGEVFGYLCSRPQFVMDYANNPSASIYTSVFLFSDVVDSFCIAVGTDTPHLRNFINTYISKTKLFTNKDVEENF